MQRAPEDRSDGPTARTFTWSRRQIGAGISVVVVLLAAIAVLAFRLGGSATGTAAVPRPTASPTPSPSASLTVSQIYQRVGPSVVLIRTATALGTGVIVANNGTILTANHIIAGAKDITVAFADGTVTRASVASSNPAEDIATLTPASLPKVLIPATLGGAVSIGAEVVAIGNPLGLTDSVSAGVVSGLDRKAQTANGTFSGLIQFDASVNPGSSGGPLLNAQGLVVGIVVSIADPAHDDAFAGIAFAAPIGAALGGGGGPGSSGGPEI